MAEPETAEDYENVIVLRNEATGAFMSVPAAEASDEQKAEAVGGAKHRKAVWQHRLAGAQARAGTLPRLLTASFAAGTVNLMLSKLLQEEIVPTTAKEAADVAKTAYAIYQQVAGDAPGKDLTPVEREQKRDAIDVMEKELAKRAEAAGVDLGGAVPPGEKLPAPVEASADDDEPNVWEHEVPAGDKT